ncbi:hypothetical protein [Sphingobacterium cavernae]|uniref:hypothetical protein n=1 Tax=Sphingobacterium cavernae TaxID=2592657 RepID=UPI0012300263|nr:hypothetical protein [Sphingobacterium cavernae]
MNTITLLLSRILRLFSVNHLKDSFDSDERLQENVIKDILSNNDEKSINEFVVNNIDYTKKSVHIYSLKNKYQHKKSILSNELGIEILSQTTSQGVFSLKGYHKLKYDAVIYEQGLKKTVSIFFKQPIKIIINNAYLILELTKVEINLKTHFSDDIDLISSKKIIDDGDAIHSILTFFDSNFKIRPSKADLNKGIKYLWEKDIIDGKELAYRKSSSRTKEIMDGEELFKNKYPAEYLNLMRNPIENCIFRYLPDNADFPSHFTCDVSGGELSFTIYPKSVNQITNVINEILKNN